MAYGTSAQAREKPARRVGRIRTLTLTTGISIYKGSAVQIDPATGLVVQPTGALAAHLFGGVALETVLVATAGQTIQVATEGDFNFAFNGTPAATSVGSKAFMAYNTATAPGSDQSVGASEGTKPMQIGVITKAPLPYVAQGEVEVCIDLHAFNTLSTA